MPAHANQLRHRRRDAAALCARASRFILEITSPAFSSIHQQVKEPDEPFETEVARVYFIWKAPSLNGQPKVKMSRRRRRVKIKSSSRLFAFILFNLLLLATCITAHYLQDQTEGGDQLPIVQLNPKQESSHYQAAAAATQGISSTASSGAGIVQRVPSILSSSQFNSFQDNPAHESSASQSVPADGDQDEGAESEDAPELLTAHRHQLNQRQYEQQQQQTDGAITTGNRLSEGLLSVSQMCLQLPTHTARHLKLCKLIVRSPSADEALATGAARGLAECRNQFRSERWNCTHAAGDHHLLTSRLAQSVGNRESGFVQAIAAAGIVHSIATACSSGSLSDCACDKTRVGLIQRNEGIWKWGGCSNNIRHGMLFARHLVELLDAVHEQARHQQHLVEQQELHLRLRRSLSSRHREPNQLRGRSSNQLESALLATPAELLQQQQQMLNFCQKNQNISQSTQIQLIKSLLSRNSLERHQDFRLAMNKHNNRVGLNAVARNMELKCRCHGLSGSCSLKTCWNRLPDFEQIGAYLKRKYDSSIHLPSAVNVNRLIPMMDRQEISAILLQNNQEHDNQAVAQSNQVAPEFAALTSSSERAPNTLASASGPPQAPPTTVPPHFNYYERHKQLERMATISQSRLSISSASINLNSNGTSQLFLHGDETPISIAPMSQQQYQALLRDMKLCNTNASNAKKSVQLMQQQQQHLLQKRHLQTEVVQQHHHNHHHKHHSGKHHARKLQHASEHQLLARHSAGHRIDQQQLIGQLLASHSRDELVHLHKSPDYCEADLRHGFAGVQSRTCSPDPLASNSCDKLCCGRGSETRETRIRYNCDCKFQYCCKIHCNYCEKTLIEHVCK